MKKEQAIPAEQSKSIISSAEITSLYLALSELRALEFYNNTMGEGKLNITEKISLIKLYCHQSREQLITIDKGLRLNTSIEYNLEYKIVESILTKMETAIKAIN